MILKNLPATSYSVNIYARPGGIPEHTTTHISRFRAKHVAAWFEDISILRCVLRVKVTPKPKPVPLLRLPPPPPKKSVLEP